MGVHLETKKCRNSLWFFFAAMQGKNRSTKKTQWQHKNAASQKHGCWQVKCPATIHSATCSSSEAVGYAMSPIRLFFVSCKAKRCKYKEFAAIGKEQRGGHVCAIAKNYPTKTQWNYWTTAAFYATIMPNYAAITPNYAAIKPKYAATTPQILDSFDWPDRGRAKKRGCPNMQNKPGSQELQRSVGFVRSTTGSHWDKNVKVADKKKNWNQVLQHLA